MDPKQLSQQWIGRRIMCQGFIGTVKYYGPLQHPDPQRNLNDDEMWLGVQWDDGTRGKHQGTVKGFTYFHCDPSTSASLIKEKKAELGLSLDSVVISRYGDTSHHCMAQGDQEEEKKSNIELDPDVFVDINKRRKQYVQLYGFDDIRKKLSNLSSLSSLALDSQRISTIGDLGSLFEILPNLIDLSLVRNLFCDWSIVSDICKALPAIQYLNLSNNRLRPIEIINESASVFARLKTLVVVDTNLDYNGLTKLQPILVGLDQLIASNNQIKDFPINESSLLLPNLKTLDLDVNGISNFKGLWLFLKGTSISKLSLSGNQIAAIGELDNLPHLKSINLEENLFNDVEFIWHLSSFKSLESVRFLRNPIFTKLKRDYLWLRTIAENQNLTSINGSLINKHERKDAEIFYLRKAFDDFFTETKSNDFDYDFSAFLAYCSTKHKKVPHFIEMYGNPFEIVAKKMVKEVKLKTNNIKLVISSVTDLTKSFTKKFPSTASISMLKNVISKVWGISKDKIILIYENNILSVEQECLEDYLLSDGSVVYVRIAE